MGPSNCRDDVCLVCSDAATPGCVLELLDAGMARIGTASGVVEACLDLVEARVGDTVLLHAGIAIQRIELKEALHGNNHGERDCRPRPVD